MFTKLTKLALQVWELIGGVLKSIPNIHLKSEQIQVDQWCCTTFHKKEERIYNEPLLIQLALTDLEKQLKLLSSMSDWQRGRLFVFFTQMGIWAWNLIDNASNAFS